MDSAATREIKNQLSRYIRRLKPGHVIAITVRGRPVAELRSPTATRSGAPTTGHARLMSSGVIRPAQERGDPLGNLRAERAIAAPKGTVAALISDDRGD
jgi:antitoxin (DNA-binding transcriptional repressor) of toxin-antitoxin stability system